MKQVSISLLKGLRAGELKGMLPFEITSDGVVIAVMTDGHNGTHVPEVGEIKTKCPNCKFVYNVIPPDNKPDFFSCQPLVS